ncbi:MAG: zeta toxin family protein [Vampirovibrionales bacterium]|jgi:predicted ABC-type ATPase
MNPADTNTFEKKPEVILFGGCNGAGKTTLAFRLLGEGLHLYEFVNADEIARGLNPMNPYNQAGLASRLAIERVNTLIKERASFAFEGTLSGKWQSKILAQCNALGYHTRLIYVWLPSVELAIERVAQRVEEGGHTVPTPLIQRRYNAGLENLQTLYLPVASDAIILDGTSLDMETHHRVIAYKRNDTFNILQPEKWSVLCQKKK